MPGSNCGTAATPSPASLAEDAFDPAYGVQKEAEVVLRDIDAEEHNQRLLAAQRTFDAGVDAYLHGEFKRAGSILANVDVLAVGAAAAAAAARDHVHA